MCGRYNFFTPLADIELKLGVKAVEWAEWQARYNAAPTQVMPVITNEFPGIIQFFRWGLVPKWAKEESMGSKMINTRAESIVEKPAFRNIFKYKRCIVLASGFYEWQQIPVLPMAGAKQKLVKQPYHIFRSDKEPLLLAGLWDTWQGSLNTFSIITCPPNEEMTPIHNRMPVALSQSEAKIWLDNTAKPDDWLALLKPAENGTLDMHPISTAVNKPVINDASLLEPLT
jgi:putative SOS response-associated peptidase YedK